MYAQLGDIVFEPLSGFHALGSNQEQVVAEYGLLEGKPFAQAMAPGLRELVIGLRLHQRFIKVKEARAQLRAYLENGSTVSLIWGNGDVEGRWLVANINENIEESDGYGNVFCIGIGLTLREVADEHLLSVKQADSYKDAFGIGTPVTPVLPERVERPEHAFNRILRAVVKYSNMIRGLAYGGGVAGAGLGGGSLTSSIANARYSLIALQQHYGVYGSDFDIPDQTGNISDCVDALDALGVIDPVADAVGFAAANTVYQGTLLALKRGSWVMSAREVVRNGSLIL